MLGQYKIMNRQIRAMSLPTMYGMLFTALYDMVDMFWIGMLDKEAVAAVTIYLTLFLALEILNEVVGTSSVSLLSKSWGSGDLEMTRRIGEQTFVFKALLGSLGALILILILPYFYRLYTNDAKVLHHGLQYGCLRSIFVPVFFSSYTVNTILRSTGDAKTPMLLLLASAVLNMVLDPLFMFSTIPLTSLKGLGWGMFGAAAATCISYLFAFLAGFWYLQSGRAPLTISVKGLFHLDWAIDKKLLVIGLPSGINMLLRSLITIMFLKLVALYGTVAIAALGIANRIYQFCGMPSNGLSMGSGILVGQRLGAKQFKEAKAVTLLSSLNGLLFSLPFILLLLLAPEPLLSLFLGGASVSTEAAALLRIYGLCLVFMALSGGLGSAFFGSGHTSPILYTSLISGWLVQIPYALLVVLVFQLELPWLWAAYLLGDSLECLLRYRYFRLGGWMQER